MTQASLFLLVGTGVAVAKVHSRIGCKVGDGRKEKKGSERNKRVV